MNKTINIEMKINKHNEIFHDKEWTFISTSYRNIIIGTRWFLSTDLDTQQMFIGMCIEDIERIFFTEKP